MILINPNVTDLSAGYALISAFMVTLEATWLPGFERSYKRRTSEYRVALEKYENRGLFLRTLLRKPKQPQRMPAGYKEDVAERLHASWVASFTANPPTPLDDALKLLQERLDDNYLAVIDLLLQADLVAPIVVLGPPGIILAADGRTRHPYQLPPEQLLQQSAIALREELQQTEFPDTPVHAGRPGYWEQNLGGIGAQRNLDQRQVFALTDALLARRKEHNQPRPFSALSTAEKLTGAEKDNLLRMAATL